MLTGPAARGWTTTSLGIELGNCQCARASIIKVCKSKVTLPHVFELICTSGAGLYLIHPPSEMREHLHGVR